MEDPINFSQEIIELKISEHAVSYLRQISKWSLFVSIIGFIFIGLCIMASVFYWLFFTPFSETPVPVPLYSYFYLGFGIVYFFPVYYLYRFSTNLEDALMNKISLNLEQSFACLKSHYKFLGMLIIGTIGFYLFFFIGMTML